MNNKFEIIKINKNALEAFISFREVKKVINNKKNTKQDIVKFFNEKIDSKKFNKLYKDLIKTVCKTYRLNNKNIWFQKRPTVRVFFENEIKTLDYPILDSYLYNKKIKGILIASKDLIPTRYLKFIGKNKFRKKIGFALENTITNI